MPGRCTRRPRPRNYRGYGDTLLNPPICSHRALCRAEPGRPPARKTGAGRASAPYLVGRDDGLVIVAPMLERCNRRFRDLPASSEAMAALRGAETIRRPLRSPAFLDRLAPLTGL